MKRRQFLELVGGASVTAAFPARAQKPERVARIGWPVTWDPKDSEAQARIAAVRRKLREFGWTEGRNLRLDIRWTGPDPARRHAAAEELVAAGQDVILFAGSNFPSVLRRPEPPTAVVFVQITDPVGLGLVQSIARPGGHITGFIGGVRGMTAKRLQIFKELSPGLTRVTAMLRSEIPSHVRSLRALQKVAPSFGIELVPAPLRVTADIDRVISVAARGTGGGLFVFSHGFMNNNRGRIIGLAAKHKLPAAYAHRFFVTDGGLISHGVDVVDLYRRAAEYAGRILGGENPGDLPVQYPTKFQLVVNLRTAKALGITVPIALLLRADEVIE